MFSLRKLSWSDNSNSSDKGLSMASVKILNWSKNGSSRSRSDVACKTPLLIDAWKQLSTFSQWYHSLHNILFNNLSYLIELTSKTLKLFWTNTFHLSLYKGVWYITRNVYARFHRRLKFNDLFSFTAASRTWLKRGWNCLDLWMLGK